MRTPTPRRASPADLWAVEPEHQVEQGQQPAASDPLALSLEDELDALLNAHPEPLRRAQATVGIAPEPAWQSAYPADARWAALEDEQEEAAQEIAAPPRLPLLRRSRAGRSSIRH